MSLQLTIPEDFKYVLVGTFGTVLVTTFLNFRINQFRKEANVAYPAVYADNSEISKDKAKFRFNCAQRGVQNLLELYPHQVILIVIWMFAFFLS